MDGDLACQTGATLVFAADQPPFPSKENRFCVLHPLMTLDGEELNPSHLTFPNRGRVWWLLRDNISDDRVLPGTIWTATLDHATKFDPTRTNSDKYQVNMSEIQFGGHELIEIIPVAEPDPSMLYVQRGLRLKWDRPATAVVWLRGSRSLLGPFKSIWHSQADGGELELQAMSAGNPQALRVPAEVFKEIAEVRQFQISVSQHHPNTPPRTVEIELTRQGWLKLDQLRKSAEILDASTDNQIINWALKHFNVTKAEGQPVKSFFNKLAEEASTHGDQAGKLQRLQELSDDAERVMALGEQVAVVLAESQHFEPLVRQHLDEAIASRLKQAIALRRGEVEQAIQLELNKLAQLQRQQVQEAKQFESQLAAREREVTEALETRQAAVDQRERDCREHEEQLRVQERTSHERLERLIERFQSEGDRLADEMLTQIPWLGRLAVLPGAAGLAIGGGGERRANGHPVASRGGELAPGPGAALEAGAGGQHGDAGAASSTPVVRGEPLLRESDFLEQLRRLVERRGYQFCATDLYNFHTCLKIGGLTVLAGPSGTGKSSLPQLYAEALGHRDLYQHTPVRPDWLDDRDFIGAFNPLVRRFEPANSGVVERLIAAAELRDQDDSGLFVICLDEMNLARVEHYFAQFLSVMERPVQERAIHLFSAGVADPQDPYAAYCRLPIGDNVRFLGTVNIDETTHFFSPKVLDRTQVVCLTPPDLSRLKLTDHAETIADLRPVPLAAFRSWVRPAEEAAELKPFLLEISQLLEGARLGLRARQFNRVLQYCASARGYLKPDEALDFQIMQVVLPRLRRTAPRFEETTDRLRRLLPAERFPRSAEMLERIAEQGGENDFFQLL